MIREKNLKQKISWHCPFKSVPFFGAALVEKFILKLFTSFFELLIYNSQNVLCGDLAQEKPPMTVKTFSGTRL